MGEISRKLSDIIILTSEDPRGESSEKIADDIKSGMQEKTQNLFFDADRQQAINLAIQMAQKGDIVIITGKGHEKSMNLGHGETAWSDHDAVKKALENRAI